jgi:hypothetical protein
MKRTFTLAAAIFALAAGCRPGPKAMSPFQEKAFQRREVGGKEDFTVRVRATRMVPPEMLEVLERTLEVRRIGKGDRPAELAFWLDEAMAPDSQRAEVVVELVPVNSQLDPKQFVWTWPDLFQMSRPGVLELSPLRPERMPQRPDARAQEDVGVVATDPRKSSRPRPPPATSPTSATWISPRRTASSGGAGSGR